MKIAGKNKVLGIMNMLCTEESYIRFSRTLWVLRAIMMNVLECKYIDGSYGVNDKSEDYWIYELTNNLIAVSDVHGYCFYIQQYDVKCHVSNPRVDGSFLTYQEAKPIADEIMNGDMLSYLYRLKKLTSFAHDRPNDKAFYVYVLANDLICAIKGETKVLN